MEFQVKTLFTTILVLSIYASHVSCQEIDETHNEVDGDEPPDSNKEPTTLSTSTELKTLSPGFRQCDSSGRAFCAETDTCCKVSNTTWRCCPLASATCCADKKHCCPRRMSCHKDRPKCRFGKDGLFWRTEDSTLTSNTVEPERVDLFCPGRRQQCPSRNTCCPVGNSTYGCCPYADAVCCSDRFHCCPRDSTCDVEQKKCVAIPPGVREMVDGDSTLAPQPKLRRNFLGFLPSKICLRVCFFPNGDAVVEDGPV